VSSSKARPIIRHYATLIYWYDGLVRAASCWRTMEAAGFEWSEEERNKLCDASIQLEKAKDIVDALYSKRIGDATTFDVRNGQWREK
jgi:hypothetical protein